MSCGPSASWSRRSPTQSGGQTLRGAPNRTRPATQPRPASGQEAEPAAERWLRPFVGAREYVQGTHRWILALHHVQPHELASLPLVRERLAAVAGFRNDSKDAGTRKLAGFPTVYHVNTIPTSAFLVVPQSTSQRREYVPIGWLEPPTIPSNLVSVMENATLTDFGLLTSAVHMAWLRQTGGRIKSDYRYSIGVVYNTFPTPAVTGRGITERPEVAAALVRMKTEAEAASRQSLTVAPIRTAAPWQSHPAASGLLVLL